MTVQTQFDDPKLIWAIIIVTAVAVLVFLTGTLLVGQMVVEHGFASDQAGYVISAELAGMAVAALPAQYWLYRVDSLAKAVRVALVAAALGNGLSIAVTLGQADFNTLLILRFLIGLPCGSLMVICIKTIAQLRDREWCF